MRVNLRTLKRNPIRDFAIDPIDQEQVELLRRSIHEHEFWGGVSLLKGADDTLYIAAGHHRIEAALAEGITEADLTVPTRDWSDVDLVRIYATENATQRGDMGVALTGAVAGGVKVLAKALATDNLARIPARLSRRSCDTENGQFEKRGEVGRKMLEDFFDGILKEGQITQALANLSASGDYRRILDEVDAEVSREREVAEQARLESEREFHRLEAQRLEAKRRYHEAEEARRLAEVEAEEAKQAEDEQSAKETAEAEIRARTWEEEQRQEHDQRRQAAAEQKQKAAVARKQAEEAEKAQTKLAHAIAGTQKLRPNKTRSSYPTVEARSFDFQGVSKHLKNAHQIDAFREIVTGKALRDTLPVENQAALAAALVAKAKELSTPTRERRVTERFIREHIMGLLFSAKIRLHADIRQEQQRLMEEDQLMQARLYQRNFSAAVRHMATAGQKLGDLAKNWPAGLTLPVSTEFRQAVINAKRVIDTIVQHFA